MNENHQERMQKIYKVIMLIILTSFITFMITSLSLYTYFTNNPIKILSGLSNNMKTSEIDSYLSKIKTIIDSNYLWKENINEQKLTDSAIEGYVSGLGDKYTEYIPESEKIHRGHYREFCRNRYIYDCR